MRIKNVFCGVMTGLIIMTQSTCALAGTEIIPDSYTFDQTRHGPYLPFIYPDVNNTKLTDGVYDNNQWVVAGADKFVGWLNDRWVSAPGPAVPLTVNIDFVFSGQHTINQIEISTTQNRLGDVVIPDADIYSSVDGYTWVHLERIATPESDTNNGSYQALTFSGLNITETNVRVALSHIDRNNTDFGPWIFTDEIDFLQMFVPVAVDIKPGGDQNSINLCSNGAVPVAIFGSDTFDVFDIKTDTLRFAEASVKVVGKKDPHSLCRYDDVNGDSVIDLVCHFITTDIAGIDGETTSAAVNGELLDGTAIKGEDGVNIVKDTCN